MLPGLPARFPLGDFLLPGMLLGLLLGVGRRLVLCMLLLALVLLAVLWIWMTVFVWRSLDCPGGRFKRFRLGRKTQLVWFFRVFLGISLVLVSGRD